MRKLLFFLLALACTYTAEGRDALLGTTASQYKQNDRADEYGLPQVSNDKELEDLKHSGNLVPLPPMVKVDKRLEEKWRYCLPDTAYFLGDVGLEFRELFGRTLQVNSAIRTKKRQLEIEKSNSNAVPISGRRRTSHITGATVDIAKIGLTQKELDWLRKRLVELENLDLIEATEEHLQAVFHIMVFKTYTQSTSSELRAQ